MLLSCYSMEFLQRKDFIQSTMVYKEIARNEQLLENIFPKHIIKILHERK